MSGKPCIDVLVVVPDLNMVEDHVAAMEQAGFEYLGQYVMDRSRLFRVMQDGVVLANIHFFPAGHPHIVEMLALRDYLRSHHEEVVAYSELKRELCTAYAHDYRSYRKYKDEYVHDLQGRALQALEK
jgi:GrpB-like predicted nucleotidyltransferase (UPF0157 family)